MLLPASNFLVPNGTFIVVLLAFLVVLWVIGKKVLPILNKALAERQDQIRGELEAADKAKADAEEADAERRAVLEQARVQAREIVAQANTTARPGAGRAPRPGPRRRPTASCSPPMPKWPWPVRPRSKR